MRTLKSSGSTSATTNSKPRWMTPPREYVRASNTDAQPFVWTATADSIFAKVHYVNVFPGQHTRHVTQPFVAPCSELGRHRPRTVARTAGGVAHADVGERLAVYPRR